MAGEVTYAAIVPDGYIIPPDDQDRKLNATGADSLFQRVRHLNAQQRMLLDLVLSGVDPNEACAQAGYKTRGGLATLARKVPDIMDRCGLTDEYLINEKLKPLLVAEETKFFKTDGLVIIDDKPVPGTSLLETPARPALGIRRDALDMAFKLRGSYAARNPDETDPLAGGLTVQIVMVGA